MYFSNISLLTYISWGLLSFSKFFPSLSFLVTFSSVQFTWSVVSDSLQPHGQQHIRPPCPSPTSRVYLNPCPLSQWSHPTISSSVVPFSSRPQLVLHIRWPKYWSFSVNISPFNEYSWLIFRIDWLDLLAVQGTLKSLLQHHSSKAPIVQHSGFYWRKILYFPSMIVLTWWNTFKNSINRVDTLC